MQLEKSRVRIRCEFGACKESAEFTVKLARVGIRSRIHICKACMVELGALICQELAPPVAEAVAPAPKSIETLKPKRKKN
ncbi:MAG: hypothetical protein FWC82_00070 [Firmicutes bacterium]|nr:hypothetical protein [Bacillota bacterium]